LKRETDSLHKFKMLQTDLKLRRYEVKGLLQELWDFTAMNCPEGNIGRFPDDEIAVAVDWGREPSELIAALRRRGWIDDHDEHRLIIHDWPDHCENTVHHKLVRELRFFADGSIPKFASITTPSKHHHAWLLKLCPGATDTFLAPYAWHKEIPPGTLEKACNAWADSCNSPPEPQARVDAHQDAQPCALNRPPTTITGTTTFTGTGTTPKPEPKPEPKAEPASDLGSANFDLSGSEPGSASGKAFRQALWKRLQVVVLRGPSDPDDGRDPPENRDWWRSVSRQVVELGGLQVLDEAVTYAEHCRDPAVRKAKDLGELRKPAAFVTGKCNAFVKSLGQSLPAPPKSTAGKESGRAAI
jgi:hypothetical protein